MYILFAAFMGLLSGYLVDYLADVLPVKKKFFQPICPLCGAERNWKAYFTQAACQSCKSPRGWRTPATLASGLLISILLWLYPPAKLGFWLGLLLAAFFGVVIIIDIEHRLILHRVSLFGAGIGLVTGSISHRLPSTLLGGVCGFIMMLVFYLLGVQFARMRARKLGLESTDEEALGFGDVTISGVLGLMLGFGNVFYGLITGILLAGLFSLLLIVSLLAARKFELGSITIPYGPFLVLGACVYIFFK